MDISTKRLPVHKHFTKSQVSEDGSYTAQCVHCNSKLKSAKGGSTSNILKHLRVSIAIILYYESYRTHTH